MKDQDKDSKDKLTELRRRSEVAAEKSLGVSDASALSPEDIQRLAHELQVHQIELEMQNEELRRTQQELEASRDKYLELYDLVSVGCFTLDRSEVILDANLTGSGLLGTARSLLIGKPFAGFLNEEDGKTLYLHFRQVLETQSGQDCDIRLIKENRSQIPVRLHKYATGNQDASPTVFRTAVTDITISKHAEQSLYESELHYRRLFETAQDGILILFFSNDIKCHPRLEYSR